MMQATGLRPDTRFHRLALIVVFTATALLPLIFLAGPYETNAGENLVLGKLAFGSRTIGFSGQPQLSLRTSFADGSGVSTIAGPTQPSSQPAWSPDGTRIAHTVAGVSANEIYVTGYAS